MQLFKQQQIKIYNSLTGQKETFKPINEGHIGMYVCGPTVYSNVHLGNVRTFMSFDVIFRYLKHLGYKVRYVRNITDAGHLENDADVGEDRIAKKARLEQIEPMEVVQRYTVDFHNILNTFNFLPPSIEPTATGHIIEQIELIKNIIDNGFAYEINGSVYFDVHKFNETHDYGKLSKRKLEDLIHNTRELDGQSDKKNPQDFALWKKAEPQHIMRWPSPWSDGFPGWHLECTAMSTKYLGEHFDIHGGGMDLLFPHHECEIAQSVASNGKQHVRYWIHNNMITIDGQKMARSLNNFITLNELFTGNHKKLEQAYSPMTIRFFILQAHYRSTVDFSNEALQASEKGLKRLFAAVDLLNKLSPSGKSSFELQPIFDTCFEALNDDLNTPIAIAQLFELVRLINSVYDKKETISKEDLDVLKKQVKTIVYDILGLIPDSSAGENNIESKLMDIIIDQRLLARANKDFATSDQIRDKLKAIGIVIKDTKEGTLWEKE